MATIHPFGSAPEHQKLGYRMTGTVEGTDSIATTFPPEVRLVRGASLAGRPGEHEFAIMERPAPIDLHYCHGDDGRAYYAKGHVPFDEFMAALRQQVNDDDPILHEEPSHCWMRACRNFQEGVPVLAEAPAGSRGAFKATWIQDS